MKKTELWDILKQLKSPGVTWVELSHQVSPSTLHYAGYNDLSIADVLTFDEHNVCALEYTLVSQYGTHVDPPAHFVQGGRTLEQLTLKEMVLPLCVIDVSARAAADNDYGLTVDDITEWEKKHGEIPPDSFVAMRTDWHKRNKEEFFNKDSAGDCHYPGWTLAALEFLCEKRNISAIGHEPPDTDPAISSKTALWAGELYILQQDKYQIEMLKNLDRLPPTGAVIFSAFPAVKGAPGFTARCFALCPAE